MSEETRPEKDYDLVKMAEGEVRLQITGKPSYKYDKESGFLTISTPMVHVSRIKMNFVVNRLGDHLNFIPPD